MNEFDRMAEYYDAIFAHKDYDGEMGHLEMLLQRAKDGSCGRPILLELGCGTGEYTRRFLDQGWDVIPVDASPGMLAKARKKFARPLHLGDITNGDEIPSTMVDAAACLYGVFSYAAVKERGAFNVLNVSRRRLRKGGLFVFDVINTTAAAASLRSDSSRICHHNGQTINVIVNKRFTANDCIVTIDFTCAVHKSDGRMVDSWRESHKMRAFTVPEICELARHANFKVTDISRWDESNVDSLNPVSAVQVNDFYFMVTAEAV